MKSDAPATSDATAQVKKRSPIPTLLVLTFILMTPTIVLLFTPFAPGSGSALPGALVAALAVLVGGVRRGLVVTVFVVLVLPLAPIGAAFPALGVMYAVILAACCGLAAYRGMDTPVYMMGYLAAMSMVAPAALTEAQLAEHVTVSASYIFTLMAITAFGAFFAFGCMWALQKKLPKLPLVRYPAEVCIVYSATLMFLTGIVAAVALTWFQDSLAGWVVLTIYVMCRPSYKGTGVVAGMRQKAGQRAVGTIAGVVVASLIAEFVHLPNFLVLIGIALMTLAVYRMTVNAPYWQFVTLLTPAMVFLDSNGIHTDQVGLIRVLCTFIGLALALASLEFNRRYTFPWIARARANAAAAAA